MKIAYFINQYPAVSHGFIRREIRAVEGCGVEVIRISIRRARDALVDPLDHAEVGRTRYLLDNGLIGLIAVCIQTAVTRPIQWFQALILAWNFGRRSGRLLISTVYLAEACLLVKWLRQDGVEHLHVHFGTNSVDVAVFARALGGPRFSFTVHGPEEFDRPEALSLGDKIARCSSVVAITSYCRSQLYRWCRQDDWPRVRLVRCGLDAMFLDQEPQAIPDAPRMLCVGRLVEQKGQLLLIEAAAALAAQGVEFELVLGGDGPMRSQIEAAIQSHRLEKRVRITGWLSNDQVRDEMRAARIIVMPSFAEGLPAVVMEAMALGRPVISTYVAGMPELVLDGINGWLVPAGDITALTEAMAEALRTPADRLAVMGRDGAEAVRAKHDARRSSEKLVELFRGP